MRNVAVWFLVSTVSIIPLALGFVIVLAAAQLYLAGHGSALHEQLSAEIIANPALWARLSGYDLVFLALLAVSWAGSLFFTWKRWHGGIKL